MISPTLIGICLLAVVSLLPKVDGHPPAPPGSAIKETVGTWEYRGCYVDFGPRILHYRFDVPEGNSAKRCTQLCADHGYGIAGLEYGSECWCDNYNIFGTLPKVQDGHCNFACPGDSTEWCGAGNRMVVYENTAGTPPIPSQCITWRPFEGSRLLAIPKSGIGASLYLQGPGVTEVPAGTTTLFRLLSTCPPGGCPFGDYFAFGLREGVLSVGEARSLAPVVGEAQVFKRTHPINIPGFNQYCGKPDPSSPDGPFFGFPLLSVSGDTESWALCTNTTANGRLDVVYSPVHGHAQYNRALCSDVYIHLQPYIIDYSNYGPQP